MAEYREINIRGVCGFYRAQIIIDAAQSQTTGLEDNCKGHFKTILFQNYDLSSICIMIDDGIKRNED